MVYTNPPPNPHRRIMLLLAGRESIHAALQRIFRHSSWHLRHVKTCYEAIEFAKSNETAVVICERDLPDGDWTTVFAKCEALPRRPNVIVTAAISDEALWGKCLISEDTMCWLSRSIQSKFFEWSPRPGGGGTTNCGLAPANTQLSFYAIRA